jgi:hypothetical protein
LVWHDKGKRWQEATDTPEKLEQWEKEVTAELNKKKGGD